MEAKICQNLRFYGQNWSKSWFLGNCYQNLVIKVKMCQNIDI